MITNEGLEKTDHEIIIRRTLNAPIDLVWQMWTEPNHIKEWWGPDGFTTTIHTMDLNPGGEWNLTMHGPDGKDYKNKSVFKEIEYHKKITYDHISSPRFFAEIQFFPEKEQTKVEWRMTFDEAKLLEQTIKVFNADEGLVQNIERLQTHMEIQMLAANEDEKIKLERVLPFPVDQVWVAISDKDKMKEWYFDIPDFQLVKGHVFDWYAGPPDGKQWHHRGEIVEVIPLKKLSHSWIFPGYSGKAILSWELERISDNMTKLVLTFAYIRPFDPQEPELSRANFVEGWKHVLHLLNKYIDR